MYVGSVADNVPCGLLLAREGWCVLQHRAVPRAMWLSEEVTDHRLLRYFRHLDSLELRFEWWWLPFVNVRSSLPPTLRTLRINASPGWKLKPGKLPPQLTSLSLDELSGAVPISVGALPASLTSLHLTQGFCTRGER